jgi:uncharacterized protein YbjT (DUF2867 family)
MAALDDPATVGRTYELGGPRIYTFKALMELILAETRRKRLLVPVPWMVARCQGALLQLLPNPPLTADQVRSLERDNIVAPGALTLKDLGITPETVEAIVPAYLDRYRRGGWFNGHRMAT